MWYYSQGHIISTGWVTSCCDTWREDPVKPQKIDLIWTWSWMEKGDVDSGGHFDNYVLCGGQPQWPMKDGGLQVRQRSLPLRLPGCLYMKLNVMNMLVFTVKLTKAGFVGQSAEIFFSFFCFLGIFPIIYVVLLVDSFVVLFQCHSFESWKHSFSSSCVSFFVPLRMNCNNTSRLFSRRIQIRWIVYEKHTNPFTYHWSSVSLTQ